MQNNYYPVIVIGGGHAGTEAALACSRMGVPTLLLTHNIETLGQMSCNPAIGGIGKSHLVKEIDAMGGVMARAADYAGIQFRTLNKSKGAAVRATRAQTDRMLYKSYIRSVLENRKNLFLFQQAVSDLIIENNTIKGVVTETGLKIFSHQVILTSGTFLGGIIHIGRKHYGGGRAGDAPANTLAQKLRAYDLGVGRLKTGTPPRLNGRTIDYHLLDKQKSDTPTPVFSFMGDVSEHPRQVSCYITHTNIKTHKIIRAAMKDSPMFTGSITGNAPRYCPSIEDKVARFHARNSHQIFVEPEGLETNEIYPNGISTSLPYAAQIAFIRSIKGFENAHIVRLGYAIEYDFFDPRGLKFSLETKAISGLFFAGQINGTTGYEEAAAQGLLAGINASLATQNKKAWHPRRDQSYLGVMVDDLITKGAKEPYRMFTSRAEYRLLLREDNADLRLTPLAYQFGLIGEKRWQAFSAKYKVVEAEKRRLECTWIQANDEKATQLVGRALNHEYSLADLLRRPNICYQDLTSLSQAAPLLDNKIIAQQVENQIKYAGYIKRQQEEIIKYRKNEQTALPEHFDYSTIKALSNEVVEKLNQYQPNTIGQASRIEGITPASISILLVYFHTKKQSA